MRTFWIIQIYFTDSGRFLCVNAYFGASINLILSWLTRKMVNKTEKRVEFSLRTIKIFPFEIVDGVKCVFCIKHAYKFLLREQVGFAAVLWRLRQCVSCFSNDVRNGRKHSVVKSAKSNWCQTRNRWSKL